MITDKLDLKTFVETFREEICNSATQNFESLYSREKAQHYLKRLKELNRQPFPVQADASAALAMALETGIRGVICQGEMGTGKTGIGVVTSLMIGAKRTLILCPPHLVEKWEREIKAILPDATVSHAEKLDSMIASTKVTEGKQGHFIIISRERAKLSYAWKGAFNIKKVAVKINNKFEVIEKLICPDCGKVILEEENGVMSTKEDLDNKKHKCIGCKNPLWVADREGPRRFALADYIKKYLDHYFDLLIADEIHEYKAQGSAQGLAFSALAEINPKTIALTGTFMGGYSSNIFPLSYRLIPEMKENYKWNDMNRWITHYGIFETITKETEIIEEGKVSKRKKSTQTREKPGLSPAVLPHYIDRTIFIKLQDLKLSLPEYDEVVQESIMAEEQAKAYMEVSSILTDELRYRLAKGDKSLLSVVLQTLLTYPDQPWAQGPIEDRNGNLICTPPILDEEKIYPKEQALINLIKMEKSQGRRVLVYCTHTDIRDITPRLKSILKNEGFKVEVLKASVMAKKRERWIQDKVDSGIDVLIANPKLVQTGLDLIAFPTIVFYEVEYSIFTLRQASRRSWRIGQNLPVSVFFFCYKGTAQEKALALVAKKMKVALMFEGDLIDEGLGTYQDEGSFFEELAKSIVEGVDTIEGSLENLWDDVKKEEKKNQHHLTGDDYFDTDSENGKDEKPKDRTEEKKRFEKPFEQFRLFD